MKKLMVLLLSIVLLAGCQKTNLTIKNNTSRIVCAVVYSDSFTEGFVPNWLKPGVSNSIQDIPEKDIKIGIYMAKIGVDPDIPDNHTYYNYYLNTKFWELLGEKVISVDGGFLSTKINTVNIVINSDYSIAVN